MLLIQTETERFIKRFMSIRSKAASCIPDVNVLTSDMYEYFGVSYSFSQLLHAIRHRKNSFVDFIRFLCKKYNVIRSKLTCITFSGFSSWVLSLLGIPHTADTVLGVLYDSNDYYALNSQSQDSLLTHRYPPNNIILVCHSPNGGSSDYLHIWGNKLIAVMGTYSSISVPAIV